MHTVPLAREGEGLCREHRGAGRARGAPHWLRLCRKEAEAPLPSCWALLSSLAVVFWSLTLFSWGFCLLTFKQKAKGKSWISEKAMPPIKIFWLKLQIQKEILTQSTSNVVKISYQIQVVLWNKLEFSACLCSCCY